MEFHLEGQEFIPLCDLLKLSGLCQTGGHAKVVIAAGEVQLNNQVELQKRKKVTKGSVVEYNGKQIRVI